MANPQKDPSPAAPQMVLEYLEAHAERDALSGRPNPRFKRSSIYCSRYLNCRVEQVGTEGLTDAEWDLTIF
jgi:hypothetical protein